MKVENTGIGENLFSYLCQSFEQASYYQTLGIELKSLGRGTAVFKAVTDERHSNSLGMVHGGLITSLADGAIGNAVRTLGHNGVMVDLSTAMITAVPFGSSLTATGKVRRAGRNIIFAEAEVCSGNRIVCHAKGTLFNTGTITY